MKQVTAQSKKQKKRTPDLAQTLNQEVAELEALHTGLVRHLTAWQAAHNTTIAHIAAVMSRTDAILERIDRNRTSQS